MDEMAVVLSPDDVMARALTYMGISVKKQATRSSDANLSDFKSHYGASPVVLAEMWHDLCTTNIGDAMLTNKEKGQKGFANFLMVHHFLWTYPRNASILASRFGVSTKKASGLSLWRWVEKVAALHVAKIGNSR